MEHSSGFLFIGRWESDRTDPICDQHTWQTNNTWGPNTWTWYTKCESNPLGMLGIFREFVSKIYLLERILIKWESCSCQKEYISSESRVPYHHLSLILLNYVGLKCSYGLKFLQAQHRGSELLVSCGTACGRKRSCNCVSHELGWNLKHHMCTWSLQIQIVQVGPAIS